MIPPAVSYMHSDLRGGRDHLAYAGRMTDKRCTIADTDANSHELPPSLLLHYCPGLDGVLAGEVDAFYLGFVAAEPHAQLDTAGVGGEGVAVLFGLKRQGDDYSVRISHYQCIPDGRTDDSCLCRDLDCVSYTYCVVNGYGFSRDRLGWVAAGTETGTKHYASY